MHFVNAQHYRSCAKNYSVKIELLPIDYDDLPKSDEHEQMLRHHKEQIMIEIPEQNTHTRRRNHHDHHHHHLNH